jgi:hypothetical protein
MAKVARRSVRAAGGKYIGCGDSKVALASSRVACASPGRQLTVILDRNFALSRREDTRGSQDISDLSARQGLVGLGGRPSPHRTSRTILASMPYKLDQSIDMAPTPYG